jgi:hypothetical protein
VVYTAGAHRSLHINHNDFVGPIPDVSQAEGLSVLHAHNNQLMCELPESLFRRTQLT